MPFDTAHGLFETVLFVAGVTAAVSIPLILRWIGPNVIYGIRTRKTLSNDDVWYEANVYGGWAMLIASIVMAVVECGLYFSTIEAGTLIAWTPVVIVAPMFVAVVLTLLRIRRL